MLARTDMVCQDKKNKGHDKVFVLPKWVLTRKLRAFGQFFFTVSKFISEHDRLATYLNMILVVHDNIINVLTIMVEHVCRPYI
jgi:predicted ester cyclase